MNCNLHNYTNVVTVQNANAPPDSAADSQIAWHRPLVTIVDIKRTMLFGGSAIDGSTGSTS